MHAPACPALPDDSATCSNVYGFSDHSLWPMNDDAMNCWLAQCIIIPK